jgi:hypothetical protein
VRTAQYWFETLSCSSCAVVVCLYQLRLPAFLLSLVSPALSWPRAVSVAVWDVRDRCTFFLLCRRFCSFLQVFLLPVVEDVLLILQVFLLPVVEDVLLILQVLLPVVDEILHLCLFNCRIVLKNLLMITKIKLR